MYIHPIPKYIALHGPECFGVNLCLYMMDGIVTVCRHVYFMGWCIVLRKKCQKLNIFFHKKKIPETGKLCHAEEKSNDCEKP